MYGTKAGVNQPDPARLFRLLQRDSLIAHNGWVLLSVAAIEAQMFIKQQKIN